MGGVVTSNCCEGLTVAGFCQPVAAVGDKFYAEVEPGGGKTGTEGDGAAIGDDGLAVGVQLAMGEAEGEVEFGKIGRELQGRLEAQEGCGKTFLEAEEVAEAEVGGGCRGIEGDRAAIGDFCGNCLADGSEEIAVVGPGNGVRGFCSDGGLCHAESRPELATLAGDEAQAEQSGLGVWIEIEDVAVGFGGLADIALGVVTASSGEKTGRNRWDWCGESGHGHR